MTAPVRAPGEQATVRGAIVLLVAVVIGLALLSKAGDPLVGSAEEGGAKPVSTTTTTTGPPGTVVPTETSEPATQTTRPPKDVKVLVINATAGQTGVAAENQALVEQAGFTALPAANGPGVDTTSILFADGYQADAEAVKAAVKIATATVAKAPAEPVIPQAAEANVVVVVGRDYQG